MREYKEFPCRGCGEDIIMVPLNSGKKHPCQPEPITSGDLEVGQNMITEDGDVIYIRGDTPNDIHGWQSHFPNCDDADSFRKDRRR